MESLITRAESSQLRDVTLPRANVVKIRALRIAFSRATPDRLPDGALSQTYTSKPLVSVHGDAMFGELAILRWLEKDGWDGVWVDTFHGGKFWRAMPHTSSPVRLPPNAQSVVDRIKAANGVKSSGAFDVMPPIRTATGRPIGALRLLTQALPGPLRPLRRISEAARSKAAAGHHQDAT